MIDQVWVLNEALSGGDLGAILTSVEAIDKLAGTWGAIKTQR
jgi:hypothetical protein